MIDEASKAFPVDTSESEDGFHPRHFSLLSVQGQTAFATLLMAAEALGMMPHQATQSIHAFKTLAPQEHGMR